MCGSWSDNDYISCDEQEGRLRESIAEAMKEQTTTNITKTGGTYILYCKCLYMLHCTSTILKLSLGLLAGSISPIHVLKPIWGYELWEAFGNINRYY